mmetsp:Transcript_62510/g.111081  ORF Transcript_62510/g.111081 Transcript_62510/m.111081 type:complete len:416 (-) Transcript_62510:65-1312(-)
MNSSPEEDTAGEGEWTYKTETPKKGSRSSKRQSKIVNKTEYRDGKMMTGEVIDAARETGAKGQAIQAATIGRAIDAGIIGSRTGADQVTGSLGINPFAVSHLGNDILFRFRSKSMFIIITQSIFVNSIALAIDRYAVHPAYHWGLYLSFWIVPILILFVLNYFRYRVPLNYILLVIFSICVAISFGLMKVPMLAYALHYADGREVWSPQCYGMAFHTIALTLMAMITCVPHGQRGLIKMAPVSILVAIVTDIMGAVCYLTYWNYIGPPAFVIVAVIMNTLSLSWIGYQMDCLSLRLEVDEYMYPVILLWCEIFIGMFMVITFLIAMATIFAGGDMGADAGSGIGGIEMTGGEGGAGGHGTDGGHGACINCYGACDGCYVFYCDCYYGGALDPTRDKNNQQKWNQEEEAQDDRNDV